MVVQECQRYCLRDVTGYVTRLDGNDAEEVVKLGAEGSDNLCASCTDGSVRIDRKCRHVCRCLDGLEDDHPEIRSLSGTRIMFE